ncbi:MAG: hypothetical protein AUK47_21270 [Deltaproteobacteria bacterium CG2_30_63_29]|nr:MAG: hypothetical protein AUK47_21270 [Deltaproteobacteria bacterium CG2_30_63_29]PJB36168.1 MAG: hypothetical protein CO108_23990 [Deltaproteobacteria bacterium CG_4_9_14_3_um_filter_63_12]
MMNRTALTLLTTVLLSGCNLPGTGGLFGNFDPVDEDFSRPRPLITAEGALMEECKDTTPLLRQDEVFAHALCLCGDMQEVGQGLVTRSSSTLLGSDPDRGHVGINGSIQVVGNFDVDGTLDVAHGLSGVGSVAIGGDLITNGDVEVTGSWDVGRDVWVAGDLQGVGSISIGRDLYLTGDLNTVGSVDYKVGHLGFAYNGGPCGCGSSEIIDVAGEVAAHQSANDNAKIPSTTGNTELLLENGEFYFEGPAQLVGSSSVVIRGRAKVFVQGDLEAVGTLNFLVEEGAELELWVSGTVSTVGNLSFVTSSDERPRAFKLFMGGVGSSLVNVGNALFTGSVYAPQVDIEYVGNLEVHGSLFANNLSGTGNLTVTYDSDVVAPAACHDEVKGILQTGGN